MEKDEQTACDPKGKTRDVEDTVQLLFENIPYGDFKIIP
jgi:hypothetical protein